MKLLAMKPRSPHSPHPEEIKPRKKLHHHYFMKKVGLWLFTLVAFLLIACWGILRIYGLPERLEHWLVEELSHRDIEVSVDKIYINGHGRFAANNVHVTSLFKYPVEISFENISLGLNLFSWMQGKPLIDHLLVRASNVAYKINDQSSIKIDSVATDIRWDVKRIDIHYIDLELLNYQIHLQGKLAQDQPDTEEKKKFNPDDIAKVWAQVEKISPKIVSKGPIKINADFDTLLHHPLKGKARIDIIGSSINAYGVGIPEAVLSAKLEQDQVTILPSFLKFARGQLVPDGNLNLVDKKGFVTLNADFDPSALHKLLPEKSQKTWSMVRYLDPLKVYAEASLNWTDKLTFFTKFDFQCAEFLIDKVIGRDFNLSGSFDGQQFYISNASLKDSTGQVKLSMLYQKDQGVKGRFHSTINPKSFAPLFGSDSKPFWDSVSIKNSPHIEAELEAPSLDFKQIKAAGTFWAEDFSYKKVTARKGYADFTYHNGELYFKQAYLEDPTGGYLLGEAYYRPKAKWVKVIKAESTMNTREAARIFSSKLETYVAPYVFSAPPEIHLQGIVDLETHKDTDFKVHIITPSSVIVPLFKKEFVFSDVDIDLNLLKHKMTVTNRKPATLFQGKSNVNLDMTLLDPTPYTVKFDAKDVNFTEMMTALFNKKDISGNYQIYGEISGNLEDMKAMKGYGEAYIDDGELYNVPFLVGLKEILDVIIPGGFSKLSKAESKFRIDDGKILIDKMNMTSTALVMIGGGEYDFVNDKVDMKMRVNFRGPLGIATFAISKLMEYKGTGTLQNTKWE